MTVAFLSFSLVTLAFFLAIPVAVFLVEVVAAIALPQQDSLVPRNQDCRRRVAVLVPAHNESIGLLPTLADIKAQMRASDRVVVVADNCADDTAAVAAAAGADVVVRNDPERKGKGYALAWGLRHLEMDPPDIVIVLDADCRLSDSAIDRLVATCALTHRPVQALDLMITPEGSPINSRVVEFAWRVKNWVRPLGLKAIGLPCQLMGTGMAFPWDVMRSADLASGSIVEDLKLGLELTMAGNAPLFCPSAIVTSDFPSSAEGVQSQRLRWEQGHIGMILTAAPRFIFAATTRRNANLMALAFDVTVPPLSLLGMLVMGMTAATGLATLFGASSAAMFVSTASLVGFIGAVFLSWLKYGRDILPPRAILLIASYVIGKLPLYNKILFSKSGRQWIRTDRRKP
jgi:cellulose synthase/poly-beta-1,6-N-acetylglucosamine synthase-like glycosyltransferase